MPFLSPRRRIQMKRKKLSEALRAEAANFLVEYKPDRITLGDLVALVKKKTSYHVGEDDVLDALCEVEMSCDEWIEAITRK